MKRIIYFGSLIGLVIGFVLLLEPTKGKADLTIVSDTLSTSRLSVAAKVLTIAGNLVTLNPAAATNFNSTSTANLKSGDVITINGVSQTISAIETTSANQFTTVAAAPSGSGGCPTANMRARSAMSAGR